MIAGSAHSRALAADVLQDADIIEDAILIRSTPGTFDRGGLFVAGVPEVTEILVASAPITGQERMVLPEGIRDKTVRQFWFAGYFSALRTGEADGDRIVLGCRRAVELSVPGDIYFENPGVPQYRIIRAEHWGGFTEAVGVLREERQGGSAEAAGIRR